MWCFQCGLISISRLNSANHLIYFVKTYLSRDNWVHISKYIMLFLMFIWSLVIAMKHVTAIFTEVLFYIEIHMTRKQSLHSANLSGNPPLIAEFSSQKISNAMRSFGVCVGGGGGVVLVLVVVDSLIKLLSNEYMQFCRQLGSFDSTFGTNPYLITHKFTISFVLIDHYLHYS